MSPVRRRLVYVMAWMVATVVTAGVSWLGIRSVIAAAASRQVPPLSAADLRDAAPPEQTTAPTPTTPPENQNAMATSAALPSPTPSDSWVALPDGRGGMAYRRTFRMAGGDVVVLAAKGDAKIEATRPKSGFTVTAQRQSTESVIVNFFGPGKASRLWAQWVNNGPYAEVTEVTGY